VSIPAIAVVFVIVWWMVFFMALPIGVKRPESHEPGHEIGAPERPRVLAKALAAAAISAAITGAVVAAVAYDLIGFRDLVR